MYTHFSCTMEETPKRNFKTILLVGRTGNGKSATGNTILGRRAFDSKTSSFGVTITTELKSSKRDGVTVNVIDTPDLCGFNSETDVAKELANCIDLAKDGIHAILVVVSIRRRFSLDEERALRGLQDLFGWKLADHVIVVFTGGDDLDDGETMEDYLGRDCPEPLKNILEICQNRYVLFDNKTKDEGKKSEQVGRLFELVDGVTSENGGKPFVNLQEVRVKLSSERENLDWKEKMMRLHDSQLKQTTEMLVKKIQETFCKLGQQMAEERVEQLKLEKKMVLAQKKYDDDMRREMEKLQNSSRKKVELPKRGLVGDEVGGCAIL